MRVVAIDPGLRNLGVVCLEFDTKTNRFNVTYAKVLDVARQGDTDSYKTKAVTSVLHANTATYNADYCVVEDQNFGRQHTCLTIYSFKLPLVQSF